MPFLRSTRKQISQNTSPKILLILFLLILSHVSVVEGDCTEQTNHKLIIAVPSKATFKNFVNINPKSNNASGFCIEVFEEVQKIFGFNHEFVVFNGSYDELVDSVANKVINLSGFDLIKVTYCAAVGDITILAERSKKVDFTAPFTESGVSMVVPVKPRPKEWIFLEPFTWEMWLATAAISVYTMFLVWFVEHRSNPEFSGPWNDQLGSALWFTSTSLFLAHREKIQSNYARIVVVVWLFLALALTQSYTANLTSMLTVSRLQPKFLSPSENVGCDKISFMKKYIQDMLDYKNVKLISERDEYIREFRAGNISAAFLEIPYAKVFVNGYCKKFTDIGTTYRFGGFGFIFQKGSSLVPNVSDAILQLSENGNLKRLEDKWLTPNPLCSKSYQNTTDTITENIDSFTLGSFWGLFLFAFGTSSVSVLLFLGHLLRNYYRHDQLSQVAPVANASDESVSVKTVRVARYLMNAEIRSLQVSPSSGSGRTLPYEMR